jgi:hypothetical protein
MRDPTSLSSLEDLQQLLNTLNETHLPRESCHSVAGDEGGAAQRHQRCEDLHDEQRRLTAKRVEGDQRRTGSQTEIDSTSEQ